MTAFIPRSAVALTVAAALTLPALAAHADRRMETVFAVPSVVVSYSELDISKPSGLEMLYGRIQSAAKSVCGFDFSPRELARGQAARQCYTAAVEDAVKQINRPTLSALHRAKTRSVLG